MHFLTKNPLLLATRLLVISVAFALPSTVIAEPPAKSSELNAKKLAQLEKQFAESLTGSTMVGQFTETSGGKRDALNKERYELLEVKKLEGGTWLFKTRIKYGKHDITVPLSLPVKWAGDTPVITVDNLPVPGLGTFTARVMIYSDHYAGFWKGKTHGGHLFGVIEKSKKAVNSKK